MKTELKYIVKIAASGEQKEVVEEFAGAITPKNKFNAEMRYMDCVAKGLNASLHYEYEPLDVTGLISFGTKEAAAEEAKITRLITGVNYKAESWNRRCSRLVDWYADNLKKEMGVGKYAPSLKNIMKEAVFSEVE